MLLLLPWLFDEDFRSYHIAAMSAVTSTFGEKAADISWSP
jgi:hypothetical protein